MRSAGSCAAWPTALAFLSSPFGVLPHRVKKGARSLHSLMRMGSETKSSACLAPWRRSRVPGAAMPPVVELLVGLLVTLGIGWAVLHLGLSRDHGATTVEASADTSDTKDGRRRVDDAPTLVFNRASDTDLHSMCQFDQTAWIDPPGLGDLGWPQ